MLAIIPENIAVSKSIRDTTLTIYSTFDSLIDQFDRLTDTNAVMGKSFNDSRVESLFYLPPEIFQNSDFQLGLEPDGVAGRKGCSVHHHSRRGSGDRRRESHPSLRSAKRPRRR